MQNQHCIKRYNLHHCYYSDQCLSQYVFFCFIFTYFYYSTNIAKYVYRRDLLYAISVSCCHLYNITIFVVKKC